VAATCSASGRLNTVPASNRSSSSSSAGGGQSAASAVLCNPSCRRTLIDGLQPHLDAHGFFLMQVSVSCRWLSAPWCSPSSMLWVGHLALMAYHVDEYTS
jgi:hypothetical protein